MGYYADRLKERLSKMTKEEKKNLWDKLSYLNKMGEPIKKNYGDMNDDFTLETQYKKYWGIKVDKMSKGDWSIGICFTYDGWFKEFYIYLNAIKWTITIGRLAKEI